MNTPEYAAEDKFAGHESDCSTVDFTKDPDHRRRVDPEMQRKRDDEVARLRAAKVPFRTIAQRLNMSLGGVQKALRRHQKNQTRSLEQELDVLAFGGTPPSTYQVSRMAKVFLAQPPDKTARSPTNCLGPQP